MSGAQKVRVTGRRAFDLDGGLRLEVLQAEGDVQLLLVQDGPGGGRMVVGNAFADAGTADELRDLADEIARGLPLRAGAAVTVTVAQWRVELGFGGPDASSAMDFTIPFVGARAIPLARASIGPGTADTLRAVAGFLDEVVMP